MNPTIETVNLSHNVLKRAGTADLCRALEGNAVVKRLSLAHIGA